MMQTVNISLPAKQLEVIQSMIEKGRFASVSEAVRDAIWGHFMEEKLTRNGFSPEAEASLLQRFQDPEEMKPVQFPSHVKTIDDQFKHLMEHDEI